VGVGIVGLPALPGGEDAHSRRQLPRYVDHLLALGQQPNRDMLPDAFAALDRPPAGGIKPLHDQVQVAGDAPTLRDGYVPLPLRVAPLASERG
jgi:hypothetical protein